MQVFCQYECLDNELVHTTLEDVDAVGGSRDRTAYE